MNDDLFIHYQLLVYLKEDHGFSVSEYENLLPYERDVYLALLKQKMEEEQKKREQQKQYS